MTWDRLFTFIILLWTFIYTTSYGIWTWKKKNKLGAIALVVIALAALILPVYTIYFRKG